MASVESIYDKLIGMDIFTEVHELSFPLGEYVVVGSGHLAAIGFKQIHDIDIVVSEDVFNKCIKLGWEKLPWTYPERLGQIYLRKGIIEMYLDVGTEDFKPTLEELVARAVIIGNVPFASLNDILNFKRSYLKNNFKHQSDIELIEDILNIKRN